MKRIAHIVLSLLSAIVIVSCNKELEETDSIITSFLTLWTGSDGTVNILQDDFGNRFMVNDKDSHQAPADTMIRVISLYTINADSTIATLIETIDILSNRATDISECENREIKQDPVNVQSVWLSGGYMNAVLGISVHSTPHILFVLSDTTTSHQVKFTLFHDKNSDKEGYTRNAYISIPLDGYNLQKGDSIFFNCKEDGADYNCAFAF